MSTPAQRPRIQFCPRCGGAEVRTVSNHEFQCAGCGRRHFINPLPAVVGILVNAAGEILLIQRARDPGRGLLSLPGGFVDLGETAEEALSREIYEETDLRVEQWRYFVSLPNEYLFEGVLNPMLDLFYMATVTSFAGARAKEEVMAVTAVLPADLNFDRLAFPSVKRALRLYAEAVAAGSSMNPV